MNRLQIHANFNCKWQCHFCSVERDDGGYDMSLSEIKHNIDFYLQLGVNELVLSGGEITDRPDFKDIIEYITGKFGFITVISNGQNWNEECVNICKYAIDRVVISATPLGPEDWNKKNSKIDRSFQSIKLFQEYTDIIIQTNTVLIHCNIGYYSQLADIFGGNTSDLYKQVDTAIFTFPIPTGKLKKNRDDIVPTWDDLHHGLYDMVRTTAAFGVNVSLKNIPLCWLEPEFIQFCHRTKSRYMVDSLHQIDAALKIAGILFKKCNECNGCIFDNICDGYWEEYKNDNYPPIKRMNV